MRAVTAAVATAALLGCGKKPAGDPPAAPAAARDGGATAASPPASDASGALASGALDGGAGLDAAPATAAEAAAFPEIAELPLTAPWRIVELPVEDPAVPATSSGGPLLMEDLAIVATSRAGFVAVDLTTANVMWSRRAGPRVAPPVELGDRAVLVGDCPPGPPPPASAGIAKSELVVGCFDIVDPVHIADEKAGVIHGPARALAAFARADGAALTRISDPDGALLYRRGDQAIRVDLTTGAATPTSAAAVADHLDIVYDHTRWTYTLDHDTLTATVDGHEKWRTSSIDTVLAGAFNAIPPRIPLVRLAGRGRGRGQPPPGRRTDGPAPRHGPGSTHDPQRPSRLLLLDVDGVDGTLGQVSHSFAGAAPVASAFGEGGTTILAIRLDDSAMRHYIAAFDGNGLAMWAWPLPEPPGAADAAAPGGSMTRGGAAPRATPPQVGLTSDGWVVVLFDDRLAIIPLLSQPPTLDLPPSRNPTP